MEIQFKTLNLYAKAYEYMIYVNIAFTGVQKSRTILLGSDIDYHIIDNLLKIRDEDKQCNDSYNAPDSNITEQNIVDDNESIDDTLDNIVSQ
jgi:hypothetical protein